MNGVLSPARYVSSVDRVDLMALRAEGKRALLLDRDNTLVPFGATCAPNSVVEWLDKARDLGFRVCVISNNWHRSAVMISACELGLEAIPCAMKPAPIALMRALARLHVSAREAVMIGDQICTDVWAGNIAGVDTILVKPQTKIDLWYTRIFRLLEKRILKNRVCEV
ncbi:HAD superfamily (subfamily IIIA) phosphatase, TIGR01668 [Coriobacterium glomerans PW2]|uniref:HAD superfamily (Subfamily IIIA) phosphatase, TIGR01668 n=1 Tax=Coriobacterium glomerans (strain ATCC 49209 / DSM 20642 / JCM 10262 / PW2) TaxID=700015 RepID=F2N7Z8_CORGP|nr:YqeG family HAD IIIA-type phosphatase [Coriobacterium glomerans]AEB07107.1 HAD superfamily (subfamily IIIA) phosphatase, TIGR01668 [Coriobacterium glomerans PW2]